MSTMCFFSVTFFCVPPSVNFVPKMCQLLEKKPKTFQTLSARSLTKKTVKEARVIITSQYAQADFYCSTTKKQVKKAAAFFPMRKKTEADASY